MPRIRKKPPRADLLPVIEALIAAVRQQELSGQAPRRRQELPLRVLVGSYLRLDHLVVEHAHERVDLDRGRAHFGEASPEGASQGIVHGERAAVLHHQVLEVGEPAARRGTQHVGREVLEDVAEHLAHEARELGLRQPVVERLVLRVQSGLGIEGAQDVGDRLHPPRTQRFHQSTDQALWCDVAQPTAVPRLAPARRQVLPAQGGPQRRGVFANIASVQRWPPFDRTAVIQPKEWQVTVEPFKHKNPSRVQMIWNQRVIRSYL